MFSAYNIYFIIWFEFKKKIKIKKNNLARLGLKEYMSYGYSNSYMSKNYLKWLFHIQLCDEHQNYKQILLENYELYNNNYE